MAPRGPRFCFLRPYSTAARRCLGSTLQQILGRWLKSKRHRRGVVRILAWGDIWHLLHWQENLLNFVSVLNINFPELISAKNMTYVFLFCLMLKQIAIKVCISITLCPNQVMNILRPVPDLLLARFVLSDLCLCRPYIAGRTAGARWRVKPLRGNSLANG